MRVVWAEVEGVRTRYFEAGDGPPLLLVHGGDLSAEGWLRVIPALAERHRVLAPDLPGHGGTDPRPLGDDLPHPHFLAHLEAFAELQHLETYAVCGNSLGAHLAVLLHLRSPERVTRLVLVNSASTFAAPEALAATVRNTVTAVAHEGDGPTWESCRAGLAHYFPDPGSVPDELVQARLLDQARDGAAAYWARVFRDLVAPERYADWRVRDRLSEVAAPTLVVWGTADRVARLEDAREAIAWLPRHRFVAFEGCGHLPFVERPTEFVAEIDRFLGA